MTPSNPASASIVAKRSRPIRSTIETLVMATIPAAIDDRTDATHSKTPSGVTPASSARCMASAMTGPSAIGSLNGMPISMIDAPERSSAGRVSRMSSRVGEPPHTNGMSALRPASRLVLKMFSMRFMRVRLVLHAFDAAGLRVLG